MLESNLITSSFVDYGGNKHGFLAYNEIHPDYFKIPTAIKKLLEQELEESKQINLNDDDELYDDNFQETDNSNKRKFKIQKGFLTKVFDFFNYKPLDDFSTPKIRKKVLKIRIKIKMSFFTENIASKRLLKVIKLY